MTREELEKEAEGYNLTYEYGVFKYKDKAGKRFESVDGETWKEIVPTELNEEQERIAELEKENVELKEEMKAKQVVLNDFRNRVEVVTERLDKKSSQLTKAKEIIKELLSYDCILIDATRKFDYMDLQKRAEDFIKE